MILVSRYFSATGYLFHDRCIIGKATEYPLREFYNYTIASAMLPIEASSKGFQAFVKHENFQCTSGRLLVERTIAFENPTSQQSHSTTQQPHSADVESWSTTTSHKPESDGILIGTLYSFAITILILGLAGFLYCQRRRENKPKTLSTEEIIASLTEPLILPNLKEKHDLSETKAELTGEDSRHEVHGLDVRHELCHDSYRREAPDHVPRQELDADQRRYELGE